MGLSNATRLPAPVVGVMHLVQMDHRMRINKALFLFTALFLNALDSIANPFDDYKNSIDYSCNVDADCTVKDVGNCCGIYPECVNLNAKVSREAVSAACREGQLTSVCGFVDVKACECVQNKCAASTKSRIQNN